MNLFTCCVPLITSLMLAIPIWIATCIFNRKIRKYHHEIDGTPYVFGFIIYAIGVILTAVNIMIYL